jgi:hypothetical protein
MTRTIIGLFDSPHQAEAATRDLHAVGFARDNISFLASNARDDYALGREASTADAGETEEGATVGATGGAVLGGVGGLLVGVGALAIPGVGPVVGGGVLLATLAGAGIGAAAGGLVGALAGAGIPEEEAHVYAEGVRRGGALVAVQVETDDEAYRAADVLNQHNAVDINERAQEYRAAGWTGFDENAQSYDRNQGPAIAADKAPVGNDDYARSSKIGTATGSVAGAATGAALGSAGGPIGTVVGGVAGAIAGGGIGAAGDAAGAAASDDTTAGEDTKRDVASVDSKRVTSTSGTPSATDQNYNRPSTGYAPTGGTTSQPDEYADAVNTTFMGDAGPTATEPPADYGRSAATGEPSGVDTEHGVTTEAMRSDSSSVERSTDTDTLRNQYSGTERATDTDTLRDQYSGVNRSADNTVQQHQPNLSDRIEGRPGLDIDQDNNIASDDRRNI